MKQKTDLDLEYSAPCIELLDICTEECFALTVEVMFEDEEGVTDTPEVTGADFIWG